MQEYVSVTVLALPPFELVASLKSESQTIDFVLLQCKYILQLIDIAIFIENINMKIRTLLSVHTNICWSATEVFEFDVPIL